LASPAPASDRRGPVALTVALAVGISAAGGVLWWRTRADADAGAATAPAERVPSAAARGATPPELYDGAAERNRRISRQPAALSSHEVGAKAYADAVAAGEKNPGEKAFRADALAFFEHNGDLGEEKAAKEGITIDELKELTVLGLVAMHIRRWDAVARLTGRELTPDERARGDELVFSASKELKAAIRAHVANGDSAEARWATIRKLEASFIEKYKALVGISPEDYDRLLAQAVQSGGG
jgi:hypothetical protein